jgi:hypothetical protein
MASHLTYRSSSDQLAGAPASVDLGAVLAPVETTFAQALAWAKSKIHARDRLRTSRLNRSD